MDVSHRVYVQKSLKFWKMFMKMLAKHEVYVFPPQFYEPKELKEVFGKGIYTMNPATHFIAIIEFLGSQYQKTEAFSHCIYYKQILLTQDEIQRRRNSP